MSQSLVLQKKNWTVECARPRVRLHQSARRRGPVMFQGGRVARDADEPSFGPSEPCKSPLDRLGADEIRRARERKKERKKKKRRSQRPSLSPLDFAPGASHGACSVYCSVGHASSRNLPIAKERLCMGKARPTAGPHLPSLSGRPDESHRGRPVRTEREQALPSRWALARGRSHAWLAGAVWWTRLKTGSE